MPNLPSSIQVTQCRFATRLALERTTFDTLSVAFQQHRLQDQQSLGTHPHQHPSTIAYSSHRAALGARGACLLRTSRRVSKRTRPSSTSGHNKGPAQRKKQKKKKKKNASDKPSLATVDAFFRLASRCPASRDEAVLVAGCVARLETRAFARHKRRGADVVVSRLRRQAGTEHARLRTTCECIQPHHVPCVSSMPGRHVLPAV